MNGIHLYASFLCLLPGSLLPHVTHSVKAMAIVLKCIIPYETSTILSLIDYTNPVIKSTTSQVRLPNQTGGP